MLFNTRGIVFQKVNYSESSIIVKIYTEEFGIQSYIIKGIKSKRSSFKLAYFQPLTILDLVVYHKENKNIHNIKEVKVLYAYHDVMINPVKQSFLFFLNEILFKTIKEETQNKLLFEGLDTTLRGKNFVVYSGEKIPVNDGGIALGQAYIAGAP